MINGLGGNICTNEKYKSFKSKFLISTIYFWSKDWKVSLFFTKKCSFYSHLKNVFSLDTIKYEITQNKFKICEKLLKTIKHGYLKVKFILKFYNQ
jgi:hypothetical protein